MRIRDRIKIVGVNPYVAIPAKIAASLGGRGYIPVLVKFSPNKNGRYSAAVQKYLTQLSKGQRQHFGKKLAPHFQAPGQRFRATLVPSKGGHILYLNLWMRYAAKADVGDLVSLDLKADTSPRTLPLPLPMRQALSQNPQAKMAWQSQAPSARHEALRYLHALKTPESLKRNVEKLITQLLKGSSGIAAFGRIKPKQ